MPLSKKRDKARKRLERALEVVQPNSNPNNVQPVRPDLETKLSKVGLTIGKDGLLGLTGSTEEAPKEESNSRLPLYNRKIHKPG